MSILYILCGPSGCGKSTWRDTFITEHSDQDIRYVSRDEIRFSMLKEGEDYFSHETEVFKKFTETLAQTLIDGFDVIADATHLNANSRHKLTREIDRYTTDYSITYVVFNTSFSESCARNTQREGLSQVDESIIASMYRNFRTPTLQEDMRAIDIIEVGEKSNDFSYLIEPYKK